MRLLASSARGSRSGRCRAWKRFPAGIVGGVAELFLDAQELVVLRDAVRSGRRPGLDLADAGRDGKIRDGGVLRFARSVRHDAAVSPRASKLDRLERLGQ